MPLPDDVIVYPGHGAGSACGKNLSKETVDKLGNQKKFNYALRADMTKQEFVKEVLEGLVDPPQYFPKNAVLNKTGYESLDIVLDRGVMPLDAQQFRDVVDRNHAIILDTRKKEDFVKSFISGSIWIGIEDNFGPWVGALISNLQQPIVFLADEGKEEEVVIRLSRVGYDNALGYLEGGIKAWVEAGMENTDCLDEISAEEFSNIYDTASIITLDVRKESEFESQHVEGAMNFPLDTIHKNLDKLDKSKTYYVHCQGGYRSVITASILRARGFQKLINVQGGFGEIGDVSHR